MNITETNKQIIEHLAAGKVYKEIAAAMNMKVRTIRDRVDTLKKQFDCTTVAQLVVKVTQMTP